MNIVTNGNKSLYYQWIFLLLFLFYFQTAFATPTTPTSDFIDNKDGTVTHKLTGLVWMRCSMGQTWDKATSSCMGTASPYTYEQAMALKNDFAGKSDWWLPNIAELQTILERENESSAINTALFPNVPGSLFWSSSPYLGDPLKIWIVNFYYGHVSVNSRNGSFTVRLVRDSQSWGISTPNAEFIDNKNGTVTHKRTGLVWQRCAVGQTWTGLTCSGASGTYTYDQAIALTSTFAGYSDWRVPNANELASVVSYDVSKPSINQDQFPSSYSDAFWSSSPNVSYAYYAWYVTFDYGYVVYNDKSWRNAVRLVRGKWTNNVLPSVAKIYGKLHSNTATGAALADAAVSIGTKTTTSATNGYFSLNNITAGEQVVNFSHSGYQSFSTTITIPPNSSTYNIGNRWLVPDGNIKPTISQAPLAGLAGTTFVQWGTGFTPNGTATLLFKKPDNSEYPPATVQLDNGGHLDTTYRTPMNTPAGSYTWWAVDNISNKKSNIVTYSITPTTSSCTAPIQSNKLIKVAHATCRDKWNLIIFYKEQYRGRLDMQQKLLYATINNTINTNKKINIAIEGASSIASVFEIPSLKDLRTEDVKSLELIGTNLSLQVEAKIFNNEFADIWVGAVSAAVETITEGGTPTPALKYAMTTGLSAWNNFLAAVSITTLTKRFQEVEIAKEFLFGYYQYGSRMDLLAAHYGLPARSNMVDIIAAVGKQIGARNSWYWFDDYNVSNVLDLVDTSMTIVSMKQTAYSQY